MCNIRRIPDSKKIRSTHRWCPTATLCKENSRRKLRKATEPLVITAHKLTPIAIDDIGTRLLYAYVVLRSTLFLV